MLIHSVLFYVGLILDLCKKFCEFLISNFQAEDAISIENAQMREKTRSNEAKMNVGKLSRYCSHLSSCMRKGITNLLI